MTFRNEVLEGIAAYKAMKPDPKENYYNALAKNAQQENDDYEERKAARQKAIAQGPPQLQSNIPTQSRSDTIGSGPAPMTDQAGNPVVNTAGYRGGGRVRRFADGGMAGDIAAGIRSTLRSPTVSYRALNTNWRNRPEDAGIRGSNDAVTNAAIRYGAVPAGGSADGATGSGGDAAGGVSGTGGVGGSASDSAGGSAAAGTSGDAGSDGSGTYRRGGRVSTRMKAFDDGGEVGSWGPPAPVAPANYGRLLTPEERDRPTPEYTYSRENPYDPGLRAERLTERDDLGEMKGHPTRGLTTDQILWMERRKGQFVPPREQQETGGTPERPNPADDVIKSVMSTRSAPVDPRQLSNSPPSLPGNINWDDKPTRTPEEERERSVWGDQTTDKANAARDAAVADVQKRRAALPMPGEDRAVAPDWPPPADRPPPPEVTPSAPGMDGAQPYAPTEGHAPIGKAIFPPSAPHGPPAPAAPAKPAVPAQPSGPAARPPIVEAAAGVGLPTPAPAGEQFGPPAPTPYGPPAPVDPNAPATPASPGEQYGPPAPTVGNNTPGGRPGGQPTPPPGSATANRPTTARKALNDQTRVEAYDPTLDAADPNNKRPIDVAGNTQAIDTGAPQVAQGDGGPPGSPSTQPNTAPGSLGSTTGHTNEDIAMTLNGASTLVRPGVNGGPPPIGHQAASQQVFNAYVQSHNQGGKFTPGEAMLVGMVSDYKMLLKQGRVEQANRMAYGLIQAANLEAASHGMVARDKMAAGDTHGAKQSFVEGLNYIADGVTQRLTPDGSAIESVDPRTGQVMARTPIDGRMILAGIQGLTDGTMFWKTLEASAAMLQKPDKGAEGRGLANELRRRQIALADQRLKKGNAPARGGASTSGGMSGFQADLARIRGEKPPQQTASAPPGVDNTDLDLINYNIPGDHEEEGNG